MNIIFATKIKSVFYTWFSKVFKFVQPLAADIKFDKSSLLVQVGLKFLTERLHIVIVLTVKQDIGFGIHDGSSFNFGNIGIIVLVPFLINVVQGIGSVMTTPSSSVMANDSNQIVFVFS